MYEFYDKNSTLYKAMDMLLDNLAKQYKGQAEFYKLDVDNFEVQTQPDDSMHVLLFTTSVPPIKNTMCSKL